MHIAVIQRATVVGAHDEKTQLLRLVFLQHIAHGEEIAQRLRHLFVVNIDKPVVHPDLRQRFAIRAFALRNFIFVVRKLQISAAAMDVKRFAQQRASHGRAFDVPAGAPFAEAKPQSVAVPFDIFRFTFLGRLPQHKIQRIVFAVEHRHTLAGMQFVNGFARKFAVAREFAH